MTKHVTTVHPFLVGPVLENLCTYKDIYALSLDDFVRMNEIVAIKHYNSEKARAYYESKNKR